VYVLAAGCDGVVGVVGVVGAVGVVGEVVSSGAQLTAASVSVLTTAAAIKTRKPIFIEVQASFTPFFIVFTSFQLA